VSVSAKTMAPSSLFSKIGVPGYPQRLLHQETGCEPATRCRGSLERFPDGEDARGHDPNDSEKVKAVTETSRTTNGSWRTFKSWHESKDLARQLNARLTEAARSASDPSHGEFAPISAISTAGIVLRSGHANTRESIAPLL